MEFTEFNLHPDLQKGIRDAGYTTCMPVQEQVLTHAFGGQDLYVQSQTGTGKTAAFLIVIFQRMLTESLLAGKKAIIMVPTRELAVQVEEEAKILAKHLPFKVGSFYGGVGYTEQTRLLRENAQILVGTPGRVLDLNQSGKMNLMDIAFLVIDEADRMFDMGFYPDLRKLIKVVPPADRRQTMLFSATLNAWVKNLAWEYTKKPFEIEITPEIITAPEAEQILYHVSSQDKMKLLLGILKRENPESALIFCNTKRYTEIIAKRLRVNGYEAEFIIGDLPQHKRLKVIDDIKAGRIKYLVATDVAARGLDIEGLALVVNYDLPNEAENYVHRIGRTARAGKTGKAITLASEQDVYELPAIERYIGRKLPSETATEELFGEDSSEGVRLRTEYGREGSRERGPRDRSPREKSPREKSARQERPERPEKRRSVERDTERKTGSADGARAGSKRGPAVKNNAEKRRDNRERREKPGEGLSNLSFDERMAYYKEKYAVGEASSGPGGGKAKQKPADSSSGRERRRPKRTGEAREVRNPGAHAPEEKNSPKAHAPGEKNSPAGAGARTEREKGTAPEKKTILSRILGIFRKK